MLSKSVYLLRVMHDDSYWVSVMVSNLPIFVVVEERLRGEQWTGVVDGVIRWYQIPYVARCHVSYLFVVDASEKLREAGMNKKNYG